MALLSYTGKIVGIPCNTMHSPKIFDVLMDEAKKRKLEVRILNVVVEVREYIQKTLIQQELKDSKILDSWEPTHLLDQESIRKPSSGRDSR